MKYRLKDRELQRKLDEITKGEFSKNLYKRDDNLFHSFSGNLLTTHLGKTNYYERKFGFWFFPNEIEEVPQYDPTKWNRFPEVTPPEGVWMRVETDMGFGFKARFQFGDWLDNRNDIIGPKDGIDGAVCLFRPWEDPE